MKIWLLSFAVFVSFLLHAEKSIAVLHEVEKPNQLIFSEDNIYVAERYKIHIYDRQTFKYKKNFGKKGEGPEEFPLNIRLNYFNNELVVISFSKILWFSKEGNYIKEARKKTSGILVIPILNGYLKYVMGFNKKENYVTGKIGVFDKKMNMKKVLFERKDKFRRNLKEFITLAGNIVPITDKNNIVLADKNENFTIKVFDHNGMLIRNIKKSYPKIIITQSYKKHYIENIINNQINDLLKHHFKTVKYRFPKYLPAFTKLFSEGKIIYVFRDVPDFSKYEIYAMTKSGEVMKKVKVNKAKCYWIEKGVYYYIMENDEDEEWELFSQRIL